MKSRDLSPRTAADAWPFFMPWLVWVALADWFITRTLSRSAIFMPKSPVVITLYQVLTLAGQVVAALSALLVFLTLVWIIAHEWRGRNILAIVLAGCAGLGLLFVFVVPVRWLAVSYQGLILLATLLILWRPTGKPKIGLLLPAAALILGGMYQLTPAIFQALHLSGPPPFTGLLFNLGELFVVLSPIALWLIYGRNASPRIWLVAAIPALLFGIMRFANPAMTGIIAIWSMGLTLYLPWPAYVFSLWLAGVTCLGTLRSNNQHIGWAIVLFLAAAYAPQFTTQAFLGLIALWLLAAPTLQVAEPGLPAALGHVPTGAEG